MIFVPSLKPGLGFCFLLMLDNLVRTPAETLETYMTLDIPPTVLGTPNLGPQRMNLDEDPVFFLSAIPHKKES